MPVDGDARAWFELFDDAEVMRYIGDGRIQPLEWYEAFVARQQGLAASTGLCLFSVVRTDAGVPPGTVAGFVGVQPWTQPWGPTDRLEIGWRLGTAHTGLGLATSAARLCLTRAVARGIHDPIAMIDVRNAASIAVARRLGLASEGEVDAPTGARVAVYGFGAAA